MKALLLLLLLLSSLAFAKYDIFPDTVAIGDLAKPEAGAALVVQSTSLTSLPCPKMTEIQRDALVTKPVGSCVYNTTLALTQFYNGATWNSAGSGAVISAWATGVVYGAGSFVYTPDFKLYLANTAHTAGATFAGDVANWDEASDDVDNIASATDNAITRFDGTTGDLIQDSGVTISDTNDIVTSGDVTIKGNLSVFGGILKFTSTGIASPTTMTTNGGDNTKFDVGAVSGQVVDPAAGTYTIVTYAGGTALTPTNANGISYILVDDTSTLIQQTAVPSAQEKRENVFLGRVITNSSGVVTTAIVNPVVTENIASTVWDFFDYLGVFNVSGNLISYNGANLNINRSSGYLFDAGANYGTNRSDPNRVTISACTTCSVYYNTRTGLNSTSTTAIVPGSYDLAGTITSIPGSGNRATNQRIYLFPSGNMTIQYGQQYYSSLSAAVEGAASESFVENPAFSGGVLTGIISLTKGATDLSNNTHAIFSVPTQFGRITSGAGAAVDLQGAYDHSSDGQIVLDSTRTSFEIRDNASTIGSPFFEILSNDEATSYFSVDIDSVDTSVDMSMSGTGALKLPEGTTAQRPTGADGKIRYNTDLSSYEGYKSGAWAPIGGDLQAVYDASTNGHILLDATRTGMRIKNTTAGLGGALLGITNDTGSVDYWGVTSAGMYIDGAIVVNSIKDEDDMASDSNIALVTQQSVKAYVDNTIPAGVVNYLADTKDSDFEISVGNWVAFNDGSVTVPLDGTGGASTAGFSCTRNTTTPIRLTGDLKLTTPSASDTQGEGCSVDFDIDKGMQAQKLTGSAWIDLSAVDDDDFAIFVYDKTNTTMIRVNGEDLKGGSGKTYFQFQTASNSTAYRLIIMNVDATNTTARSLYFDEVAVGPTNLARGPTVTDWISYTPTGSWTTNTTYTGQYKRVGDSLEVTALISTTGAPNSGDLNLNLPDGLNIDESKLLTGGGLESLGDVYLQDSGTANLLGKVIYIGTTSSVRLVFFIDSSTTEGASSINYVSPFTFASGDTVWARFKVPIQGWSSDSAQSSDLGGREVVVHYRGSASTSLSGTPVVVKYTTKISDTTASYDTSTGVFTVPESGYYDMEGGIACGVVATASNQYLSADIYVDGVQVALRADRTYNGQDFTHASVSLKEYYLTKGQEVDIRALSDIGASRTTGSATTYQYITIAKRASPQTILETETVAARYTSVNGLPSLSSGTATLMAHETATYDTHGFCDGAGICTVPSSGKYKTSCTITAAYPLDSGEIVEGILRVNDIETASRIFEFSATNASQNWTMTIEDTSDLSKGDTVKCYVWQNSGSAVTPSTTATRNVFTIERIK